MPELYWSDADDQWLSTQRRLLDEDGMPPTADVYFAGTPDEHTVGGATHDYAGPGELDIRAVWDGLTEKQRFVIGRLRGLNGDGHPYTQQEIADTMGLTQQAVDAIEKRALARLRHLLDAVAA